MDSTSGLNSDGGMSAEQLCTFCDKSLDDSELVDTLTKKGADTLNKASVLLKFDKEVTLGQRVHHKCRLGHYNKSQRTPVKPLPPATNAGTIAIGQSDDLEICFLCEKPVKTGRTSIPGNECFQVKSASFQGTIEKHIAERNDKWADEVKNRIGTRNLQHSAAWYHQKCNAKFRQKSTTLSVGRPQDERRQVSFLRVVDFMNSHEDDAFTINELVDVMKSECAENVEEYCGKFLKKKLMAHFGENVCVFQSIGKPDYIVFRHTAHSIISDFHQKKNTDAETAKREVLENSSKLMLSDLNSIKYNKSEYPAADDISKLKKHTDVLPESLLTVLKGVIKSKNADLKIASIGQAIVQAACPRRVIAPLQIGLSVLLHHLTGSKFIIQTLNRLGFCSSYDEVKRFELCASVAVESELEKEMMKTQMVKYVADNIDHDTRSIDGKNTFHAMGMISAHTPAIIRNRIIKRIKPTIQELRSKKSVEIHQYLGEATDKNIFYGNITSSIEIMKNVDILVNVTWKFQTERPFWSGIMQSVNTGDHPGKSSITILPIIDLNPSDLNCIYSTLVYLANQAEKHKIAPVITFDQPLYWKAYMIIQNEREDSCIKKIILLLGGFHTQMSYLGTIGKLCEGLGLQETLETVYATNSVPHILSGKAYSRAIRGYFMVDIALNNLFMEELVPQNSSESEWKQTLSEAEGLFDDLLAKKITLAEIEGSQQLKTIREERIAFSKTLTTSSRTAKHWLQFMEMVGILKSHIRSERIGDWQSQLSSLRNMLPYNAASGHNSYTKCLYIFLQEMEKLQTTHPVIHELFTDGHFVIRRSDRYWAGLPCDLTIEQVLMKNIKSQIGLTRGRGIAENQRLVWINSMPECVNVKNAMQELTGLHYQTSEQHKDVGASRQKRDLQDSQSVLAYLKEHNPFKTNEGSALRNIHDGMEASKDVNVDKSKIIGEKVIESMQGKNVAEYVFKKANQAVLMHSRNTIVVDGEACAIDPQLLFQRLILVAGKMDESQLEDVFTYELSHRPSSIFDEFGYMRSGDSTSLDNALLKEVVGVEEASEIRAVGGRQILSGEYLLNKVIWKKNQTYDDILRDYVVFVQKFSNPTIIFDSYTSEPSILDEYYLRTSKRSMGVKISFTGSMPFNSKKETFLFNTFNKQRFTEMLSEKLIEEGYTIYKSNRNLNVMIAKTAMQFATENETMVISDDPDLLYVMCSHFEHDLYNVYFKYDVKNAKKQLTWNVGLIESVIKENIRHFPFVNAITGCKTTSHLFGVGKGSALKKLLKASEFQSIATVFGDPNSEKTEIIESGNKAIIMLYNGRIGQTLNELRYGRFAEKVYTAKSVVEVQTLPMTESAAYYHLLRVYLQTQIWLGNEHLDPLQYGWRLVNNKLSPKTSDQAIAPKKLLSSIRCGCKGDCSTKICSCKKNSMSCSVACTVCRGICCLNPSEIIEEEEDEEIE